jgi:hypothetical protein
MSAPRSGRTEAEVCRETALWAASSCPANRSVSSGAQVCRRSWMREGRGLRPARHVGAGAVAGPGVDGVSRTMPPGFASHSGHAPPLPFPRHGSLW